MTERAGRSAGWWWALITVLSVAAYANAFGHELVFDDITLVGGNGRIRSLRRIGECFTTNFWGEGWSDGLYRPLVLVSLALNHAVSGIDTWSYALVNVLLHAVVACLVFATVQSLGAGRLAAGAAGVLFAVHPVHTEAVDAIVGRAESMCALFALAALLAHHAIPCPPHVGRTRALAAGALLAALLSKENAVAVPGVLIAMDLLVPRVEADGAPARWRERLDDYGVYAAVLAVYLALRWSVLGRLGPDPASISVLDNPLVPTFTAASGRVYGVAASERVLTAIAVFAEDLRLLAWPARLSADHSLNQIPIARTIADPRVVIGLVFAFGSAGLAAATRRRAPLVAFGLAFLWIALSATSNVALPVGTILAERLLYLPSIGVVIAVGVGIGVLARSRRQVAVGLLVALTALGAARTWTRNPDWSTPRSLWEATAAASPESAKALVELGKVLWNEAEAGERAGTGAAAVLAARERAVLLFERALVIYPDYDAAPDHLADLYRKLGDLDAAIGAQERALEIRPDDPAAGTGLGVLLVARAEQAQREAEQRPQDAARLRQRAAGDVRRALETLEAVLRANPGYPPARQARSAARRLGD
jgi:tetratricopeptide (TPR) repeat protein